LKKHYNVFLESAEKLETQLSKVDSRFNEVQAKLRKTIEEERSGTKLRKAELQKLESDLALQNTKLAQVDAQLDFIRNLKFTDFEAKDTLLSADLEKINIALLTIKNELENIDTQIE